MTIVIVCSRVRIHWVITPLLEKDPDTMNLLSIKAPRAAIVLLAVSATACNYDFNSAYDIGETSVSYTGQTKRQILITDLVIFKLLT